jgi:hypothetical protein
MRVRTARRARAKNRQSPVPSSTTRDGVPCVAPGPVSFRCQNRVTRTRKDPTPSLKRGDGVKPEREVAT